MMTNEGVGYMSGLQERRLQMSGLSGWQDQQQRRGQKWTRQRRDSRGVVVVCVNKVFRLIILRNLG